MTYHRGRTSAMTCHVASRGPFVPGGSVRSYCVGQRKRFGVRAPHWPQRVGSWRPDGWPDTTAMLLRGAKTRIRAIGTPFLVSRLRLTTGLVLFAYVATHNLNHMLGIVSLEVMEEAQYWFVSFWQFLPCALVLYASLALHYLLALWAIYRRRFLLRMRAGEAFQLIFGLSIVPLLAEHGVGTRMPSAGTDL